MPATKEEKEDTVMVKMLFFIQHFKVHDNIYFIFRAVKINDLLVD